MKQVFANFLRRIPVIYKIGKDIHASLFITSTLSLEAQIERRLRNRTRVFFIQIGSNDGYHGDPLYNIINRNANWSGIFIEPVKHSFQKLEQNYNYSKRFIFENVAIAHRRGFQNFYYVSESAKSELECELPFWVDQLGSFKRDHIIQHFGPDIEPFVVEITVECVTLNEIFHKHNIKSVDLIHMDTEGFDYRILIQIDFKKYRPTIILFEHKHLSNHERKNASKLLKKQGYTIYCYGADTLATCSLQKRMLFSIHRYIRNLRIYLCYFTLLFF